MPTGRVKNLGNLFTNRAWTDDLGVHPDRALVLADLTNKARSTVYQYTEVMPPNGSGLPSPLHNVCESVRRLDELCREQNCPIDCAQEHADCVSDFLAELRSGRPRRADATGELNMLMKAAADANFLLKGRYVTDLTPQESKEFGKLLMNAATLARSLATVAEAQATLLLADRAAGAPVAKERARATG